MTTLITSDIHVRHQHTDKETGELRGIIPYTGRPFDDIFHMEDELLHNFLSSLKPTDTLIIVGDAAMGDRNESLKWFDNLPCRKILVLGNHDHVHPMFSRKKRAKWIDLYNQHFDVIVQEMDLMVGNEFCTVNHFPFEGDHSEDRYNAEQIDRWRPLSRGQFLLHGHVHSELVTWDKNRREIHVGIDADYTYYGVERYHPIPLEVIEQIINEVKESELIDDEPF